MIFHLIVLLQQLIMRHHKVVNQQISLGILEIQIQILELLKVLLQIQQRQL